MKAILFALLQVVLASGILYGYYHLMLRNKKFHQYNRFYLLAAAVISVLIPFLNIPVYFEESEIQSSVVLQTLQSISSSGPENEAILTTVASAGISTPFNWNIVLYSMYVLAALLFLIRILISLKKIIKIIKNNPVEELEGVRFVNTIEPGTPYSFFRWLFWNKKIELRSEKGEQIFRHEIYHIQQKHSLDIIFIELLTVVFWINPFFHLMKKEIKAIHEFLADQFAAHKTEKWEYAELLLMQALNTQQHLVNPFFHNQIKRRIAMITNPKKTSHRYLRKLLVLPVAAIVVALFAFSYKKKQLSLSDNTINPGKTITIVIDAAHGGTDPGVMSPDKKYSEAQIALEIAQQIQKLAAADEYTINVVMTREDDKFPGNASNKEDGLKKRVEIVNKIKPDAFIAIHVNGGNTNNGNQAKYSGIEAYVSDKREDAKGRLLASAILNGLSLVYKTRMELKQRKEAGVYVLDHNSYPAVLLECGYINNPEDLAFITDKSNQEKIARSILEAVINYKNSIGKVSESRMSEEIIDPSGINGTVQIEEIDSDNSKEPSKVVINGKEFEVKDLKVEGLENSKIVTADFRISKDMMGKDTSNPLIVIDGVKQEKNSTFSNIDPASIESINVLKGQTAITKYGKDGKNGVIEIFTKQKIRETTLEEKSIGTDNKIFEKVEIEPAFPGGEAAWRKFLERNLNASVAAQNNAPAGEYTVYIQFVVHTDGRVSDVKPLTNHGFGMEQDAMRIIKKGPYWVPAIQNGKNVNAYKKQRVEFIVKKENRKTLPEIVMVAYIPEKGKKVTPSKENIPSPGIMDAGSGEWRKFFERNLDPNAPISEGWVAGTYKILIQFAQNEDGTLSEIKALTYRDSKTAEHCINMVKHVQKMLPQKDNDRGQKVYFVQPFTFQITSE